MSKQLPKPKQYYDIHHIIDYGKEMGFKLESNGKRDFWAWVCDQCSYGSNQNTLVDLYLEEAIECDDAPDDLKPFLKHLAEKLGSEITVKLWW